MVTWKCAGPLALIVIEAIGIITGPKVLWLSYIGIQQFIFIDYNAQNAHT